MPDPYQVLGVREDASDGEIRAAYRRLVQLHHPDHNGGSADAARRFEQVQEAYTELISRRRSGSSPGRPPEASPDVETQLADLEREVREAREARERALRAAREAAAQSEGRPSDEELGYVETDDSFSRILADALDDLAARIKQRES